MHRLIPKHAIVTLDEVEVKGKGVYVYAVLVNGERLIVNKCANEHGHGAINMIVYEGIEKRGYITIFD